MPVTDPVPDADNASALMVRLAAGEAVALGEAYDRYAAVVHAVALRVTGEAGDAEEVTQDTFRALWSHAGTLAGREVNLTAWLVTAARRRAIDVLRKRRRRIQPASTLSEPEADGLAQVRDDAAHAGEALVGTERAEIVKRALAELPQDQKRVVRLAFFSGLSHSEIAAKLTVPLGTVKSRLRYALEKMQTRLQEVRDV